MSRPIGTRLARATRSNTRRKQRSKGSHYTQNPSRVSRLIYWRNSITRLFLHADTIRGTIPGLRSTDTLDLRLLGSHANPRAAASQHLQPAGYRSAAIGGTHQRRSA